MEEIAGEACLLQTRSVLVDLRFENAIQKPHFFYPDFSPSPALSTPHSLFLALSGLMTPPGLPETNNGVRNHLASVTAHPIPTYPYLTGSHPHMSPRPPSDFLFMPLAETLVVSTSWQRVLTIALGENCTMGSWKERGCWSQTEPAELNSHFCC